MAVIRNDRQYTSSEYADYDVSIRRVHRLLDIVTAFPVHQARKI